MQWHPIEDGLPDDETTVLIACPDESDPVWFGYWCGTDRCWYPVDGASAVRVTHWLELPEPPQKEQRHG